MSIGPTLANDRSRAVAMRLGSALRGHAVLPEPLNVPVEMWGQTHDEWRARR